MSANEAEAIWADDLVRFEREDAAHPPPPEPVVFVGSSTFTRWGRGMAEDLAPLPVVNRGFGGCGTRDVLGLADRIVTPLRPTAVVYYAGDNDIACGASAASVADNYRAFVERIRAALPRTGHLFVSIKPSPARAALWPQMAEANRLVRAWTDSDDALGYCDVAKPMLRSDGAPRAELFTDDHVHMNRDGYAIWIPLLRRALGADVAG